MRAVAARTKPLDETSVSDAVRQLKETRVLREEEWEFFGRLRARVDVGDRSRYVEVIARVEGLDGYGRMQELAEV